jgi:membrane-bound lytic murein transglycosylase
MKAPLIAVISVGIAAATPAVAVSAINSAGAADNRPAPVVTLNQTAKQAMQQRQARRFLKLRNRANRLIAKRDHRKPRIVRTADQVRWSSRGLRRAIRKLRRRIQNVREQIRDHRAGLTAAIRARLNRIAFCESKGNPRAVSGSGTFRGKYQFSYSTWRSVGGKGDPAAAPEREQDRRAAMLLTRSGSSPWPVCG